METQTGGKDKSVVQTLNFLQMLLGDYHPRGFTVRLWDGAEWPAEIEPPRCTIILKHPGALRRILRNTSSDLSLGEAYIYDDFDKEWLNLYQALLVKPDHGKSGLPLTRTDWYTLQAT